jgi:hypothetical protein
MGNGEFGICQLEFVIARFFCIQFFCLKSKNLAGAKPELTNVAGPPGIVGLG